MREVVAGSSNNGATSSLILEFGLGVATEVSQLTIQWPAGSTTNDTVIDDVPMDRAIGVTAGDPTIGDFCEYTGGNLDKFIYGETGPCMF